MMEYLTDRIFWLIVALAGFGIFMIFAAISLLVR